MQKLILLISFSVLASCTSSQVHKTSTTASTLMGDLTGHIGGDHSDTQLNLTGRVVRSVSCYRQLDQLQLQLRGPAPRDTLSNMIPIENDGTFSFIGEGVERGKYTLSLHDMRNVREIQSRDFEMTPEHDRFHFTFEACPEN